MGQKLLELILWSKSLKNKFRNKAISWGENVDSSLLTTRSSGGQKKEGLRLENMEELWVIFFWEIAELENTIHRSG